MKERKLIGFWRNYTKKIKKNNKNLMKTKETLRTIDKKDTYENKNKSWLIKQTFSSFEIRIRKKKKRERKKQY